MNAIGTWLLCKLTISSPGKTCGSFKKGKKLLSPIYHSNAVNWAHNLYAVYIFEAFLGIFIPLLAQTLAGLCSLVLGLTRTHIIDSVRFWCFYLSLFPHCKVDSTMPCLDIFVCFWGWKLTELRLRLRYQRSIGKMHASSSYYHWNLVVSGNTPCKDFVFGDLSDSDEWAQW